MKKPSDLKRMSERSLNRFILDSQNELVALHAQLSLAKREQRARRQGRSKVRRAARGCGKGADTSGLVQREPSSTLH